MISWKMFYSGEENLTLLPKQGQFPKYKKKGFDRPFIKYDWMFRAICNGVYEGVDTQLGKNALQVWRDQRTCKNK